jgi:hypothetical protein
MKPKPPFWVAFCFSRVCPSVALGIFFGTIVEGCHKASGVGEMCAKTLAGVLLKSDTGPKLVRRWQIPAATKNATV